MNNKIRYITSTKNKRLADKQTSALVTVVLVYHSFISRMKSFGNIAMISIGNQEKLIDRHIKIITKKFPNYELIISVGYEAFKIQQYVNKKYKHLNIRCVENTQYADSNVCETIRLGINNTYNNKILIVNGCMIFEEKLLDQVMQNDIETVVTNANNDTLDIGINIDETNKYVEHISYGAINNKWCELMYLGKDSIINEVKKSLASSDFKTKIFYEFINSLINKNIKIKYIKSDAKMWKINNVNDSRNDL